MKAKVEYHTLASPGEPLLAEKAVAIRVQRHAGRLENLCYHATRLRSDDNHGLGWVAGGRAVSSNRRGTFVIVI